MNKTKQNTLWWLTLILVCVSLFPTHRAVAADEVKLSIYSKISHDYSNFYSKERLIKMGIGFLAMGVVAHTKIDENIQDWYQDEMRNNRTDNYSKTVKLFGEGKYVIPISLLASGIYYLDTDSRVGNWGLNSARAYTVGLPAMWAMQNITGASRPEESSSKWHPFQDNNGVSGHAFIGAVPFLTLAKMNNDNRFLKYSAYAASALTAWSRVNDNSHYISQAILGWYMAYESVNSIFDTNKETGNVSITPIIGTDIYGLNISCRW